MKQTKYQYEYRQSASKLHVAVGEILRTSNVFRGYQSYQEYPVTDVNPACRDNSLHFDWVLPGLYLVIECHGKQHYEPVAFGGDVERSLFDFQDGKRRDAYKKTLAIEAGYTVVEVPYWDQDKLSEDYLWDAYQKAKITDVPALDKPSPSTREQEYKAKQKAARAAYLKSEEHQAKLEQARQYRKDQYNRLKRSK